MTEAQIYQLYKILNAWDNSIGLGRPKQNNLRTLSLIKYRSPGSQWIVHQVWHLNTVIHK